MGWLTEAHLAVAQGIFSREPIGWSMPLLPDSEYTIKALTMAYESRGRTTRRNSLRLPRNALYQSKISPRATTASDNPEHESQEKILGYSTGGITF